MLKAARSVAQANLFACGFRPFFLLTAASAVGLVGAWLGFWLVGLPLPDTPGGPLVWHAHELLFGFALAAVAGFTLTSVPEFTGTDEFAPDRAVWLALLWLLGRAAWTGAGMPVFALLSALADLGLLVSLLVLLAPRLFADPEQRHLSFAWLLAAMAVATAGFHLDVLTGAWPMRWLLIMIGLLMCLIVVALSRISMRIVNEALEETSDAGDQYLARPPRRNLATTCILLYTAAEFVAPLHPVAGWLALASAAALLNLTNDWHVGRALLRRWPFTLYLVYWFMAAGYGLIGIAILAEQPWISGARHLLTIGAMGIAIFAVLNIAGRIHAGVEPDSRPWVVLALALIGCAALARAVTAFGLLELRSAILLAGTCWSAAFALHLSFHWRTLVGPRTDGQSGCAELLETPPQASPLASSEPS